MLPESIFREYDIRGLVDGELTEEVANLIGRAVGTIAIQNKTGPFAVGADARASSPTLKTALIEGMCSAGCNVIDIGAVPTPMTYFAAYHLGSGCALMVTASHNPPAYNGVKIMLGFHTLYGAEIKAIYRRIISQDFSCGAGALEIADVSADYMAALRADIRLTQPLKVVIDCGNGIAGAYAPKVLRQLGCDVVELYCEVDGTFPNHPADPTRPENVADLIDEVKRTRADIGLALDGDGDRVVAVTAAGEMISPDRLMILFVRDILREHPGRTVLYDVKCTRSLPFAINQAAGKPMMWKTGHSLMKAQTQLQDGVFAGEMSGHYFFRDRWPGFDDGVYSGARLCELLCRGDPASILKGLPASAGTGELRYHCADPHELVGKFKRRMQFSKGVKISEMDGIRADFPTGFGLLRASNTAPEIVMRFEADDEAELDKIRDEFQRGLRSIEGFIGDFDAP